MTYLEKTEQVSPEDRESVRDELAFIAERLSKCYPNMTLREINRYLHQMLDVSV